MEGTVGVLQRKSRFYRWSRHAFLIDPQGFAQLSPDKQPCAPADKDAGHMAPSSIIGDPRDIDAKTVLCQKRKPLAALCDIASVSGQGQRELVLTLSTRSIVLRASSSHDRNLWLGAIMKAVLAAATAGADGTAHSLPATPRAPPAAKAPALPADVASAEIPALAKLSLAGLGDGIAAETPGNGAATDQRDTTSPKPHAAPMSASTYALPSVAADALGLAAVDGPNDKRLLGDFDFATQTENFDVDRIFDDDDVDDCVPDLQLQSKPLDSQPRDGALHTPSGARSSPTCMTLAAIAEFQADCTAPPPPSPAAVASRVNRTTEMPGTLGMDATEFGDIFGSFLDTLAGAPECAPLAHSSLDVPSAPCQVASDASAAPAAPAADNGPDLTTPILHVPEDVTAPLPATAVLSSTADITTSVLDCMVLTEYDGLFGSPFACSVTASTQASSSEADRDSDCSSTDNKPLCRLVGAGASDRADPPPPARPAAPTLDPPGQFGLGGHSLSKLKPLAEHSGPAAAPRVDRLDGPPGLQQSLLAKYSESLSASRMMRSSASRAEKPRTMLGWQTNVSKANDLRGMDRATEIVQYKPKEPADTGISRIVAGPLATGAGGGDPSRKQNVRRVRQTRSESKVVPLKSIRLRLDGSIVRSRASAGKPHGASAQTPRYTVKGGRIEGIAGQHAPGAPSASRNPASAGGQLAPAGTGREGAGSALGEFGEIQRRLKLAEEQKQQEQRRQLLDKDGVDGVRIADIIKSRQDTPLAVQIEERRRMQQAKQLAIMNQQMELRQMEAEARRQLAEQQQQHEQFRLRSLYPDARANRRNSVASAAYSMGHSEWQGCGGSIGESRMAEWTPAHGAHNGGVYSTNSAAIWQHHHLHHQQARHSAMYSGHQSRAVTPAQRLEPGCPWPQPPPTGDRPPSQVSRTVAPSIQFTDASGHTDSRYAPAVARRQPGGVCVRPPLSVPHAAQTERPGGSTRSWQSQAQHENPQYEASMAASSLVLNPQGARRSSSLGYSGSMRPVAGRPQWAQPVDGAVPPVPPLPRAPAGAHPHYGRTDSPAPSPPAYGNWVQHMPSGQGAQRMHPKWAAMAAHAPSLLQQLQQAQTTGVLPMHRPEKELYSKGAYQNAGIPPPVRGGTGVHHLGGGNTLLIDHVHDSQRTRRALIKKITTYTGGGAADTMPMPAYT